MVGDSCHLIGLHSRTVTWPIVPPFLELYRFAPWLGFWSPQLASISQQVELVLYGVYNQDRSAALGNEDLVQKLKQLAKLEEAIGGNKGDPGKRPGGDVGLGRPG